MNVTNMDLVENALNQGFEGVYKNVKKCNKIYVIILQGNDSYVTLMLQTLRYQI